MDRQSRGIVALVAMILAVACIGANSGSEVAQEFPEAVGRLCEQISQAASIRCQACNGSADTTFLFGQQERPEQRFSRCAGCSEIFHHECLTRHRCLWSRLLAEQSIDAEATDRVWEQRKRLYEQYAEQVRRVPSGFQTHDRWVHTYLDEERVAQAVFNAIKERWAQRLQNPDVQQPSLDQLVDNIPNLPGHNCAICLNNLVVRPFVGENAEIVANNRCYHELCRQCADGLIRHEEDSYWYRPLRCPSCRQEGGSWGRVAYRNREGFLRPELRPGYEEDDRVLRCAARADLYRHACLLLAAQHRQAPGVMEDFGPEEMGQILGEQARRRMQQFVQQRRSAATYLKRDTLYEIRKVGLSCAAISAIAAATFPAGAAIHGAAIGYGVIGAVSSAIAHCVVRRKEAEIAVLESLHAAANVQEAALA